MATGRSGSPARKTAAKKSATKAAAKAPAAKKTASKVSAKAPVAKKSAVKTATKISAKSPATKPATKKSAAKSPATKPATAKKTTSAKKAAPVKKAAPAKKVAKKAPVKAAPKAPAAKAPVAPAAKAPAKKAPAKKVAKKAPVKGAPRKYVVRSDETPWTTAELGAVKAELLADTKRLNAEIAVAEEEIADLLRDSGDGAGDDQADAGTKTFEREHEMSLANNSREMVLQNARALERIADGTYGVCESCGNPIGKARLQVFPRATLCVSCKQREERR